MPVNIELPKKDLGRNVDTEGITASSAKKSTGGRIIQNITFFGDSAIPEGDKEYIDAYNTARLLAQHGYTIVNGGGPGIMKAATAGAESINGKTKAIYWEPKLASYFEGKNISNTTDESEAYSNYIMRTLGLIENGDAFVIFKGGTGTISEFGMVWCIAKLYYGCHKPVILFGDFWDEIVNAFQKYMYIDEIELAVLNKANSPEEVLSLIEFYQNKFLECGVRSVFGDEGSLIIGGRNSKNVTSKTYNQVASEYHSRHVGKLISQEQLDEFISLVNPPAKILDIGCGSGMDIRYLSNKYSVKGIDFSERLVKIAKYENPNLDIEVADIITYDLGKGIYKGIWARDSIHHIPGEYLFGVFKKIFDALVNGGIFYLIVREGKGEIIEEEKKSYFLFKRFYHLFSEEELKELAQNTGFEIVKIYTQKRTHRWLVGILRKPEVT
ncbi:MAG: methyltransferase domain-containing protein [Candidatus Dojkabacteria bacterium]|nr:methyltransferase domain-containing protein [Candidatus Dojkabacteria bacterium]